MVAWRLGTRADVTAKHDIPPFSTNPRTGGATPRLGPSDPSSNLPKRRDGNVASSLAHKYIE